MAGTETLDFNPAMQVQDGARYIRRQGAGKAQALSLDTARKNNVVHCVCKSQSVKCLCRAYLVSRFLLGGWLESNTPTPGVGADNTQSKSRPVVSKGKQKERGRRRRKEKKMASSRIGFQTAQQTASSLMRQPYTQIPIQKGEKKELPIEPLSG